MRDLADIYGFINAERSEAAARWFNRLEETILELEITPRMGAVTSETPANRHLICGNKPHFYRVIYRIEETNMRVLILQVRHGKRQRTS